MGIGRYRRHKLGLQSRVRDQELARPMAERSSFQELVGVLSGVRDQASVRDLLGVRVHASVRVSGRVPCGVRFSACV